jgi:hypothetical protein
MTTPRMCKVGRTTCINTLSTTDPLHEPVNGYSGLFQQLGTLTSRRSIKAQLAARPLTDHNHNPTVTDPNRLLETQRVSRAEMIET